MAQPQCSMRTWRARSTPPNTMGTMRTSSAVVLPARTSPRLTRTMPRTFKPRLTSRHRSAFETRIADRLDEAGIDYGYETVKIPYAVPARQSYYMPDFILPNGIYVEAKGWPFEA